MSEVKSDELGIVIPEPIQFGRALGFLESVFRQVY